jgi:hypothetical protein
MALTGNKIVESKSLAHEHLRLLTTDRGTSWLNKFVTLSIGLLSGIPVQPGFIDYATFEIQVGVENMERQDIVFPIQIVDIEEGNKTYASIKYQGTIDFPMTGSEGYDVEGIIIYAKDTNGDYHPCYWAPLNNSKTIGALEIFSISEGEISLLEG